MGQAATTLSLVRWLMVPVWCSLVVCWGRAVTCTAGVITVSGSQRCSSLDTGTPSYTAVRLQWAPVLQAVPLQRDGVLPAGQGAEPAAGVCPGLGEVELEADLHPREAEAGHRDQGHRHLHLDGVVGALAVLRRAVQTLDPAHNTHSQAATTAEPSVTNVFGLTTEMKLRSSDCAGHWMRGVVSEER